MQAPQLRVIHGQARSNPRHAQREPSWLPLAVLAGFLAVAFGVAFWCTGRRATGHVPSRPAMRVAGAGLDLAPDAPAWAFLEMAEVEANGAGEIWIAQAAIATRNAQPVVFVLERPGHLELAAVEVGATRDGLVEVRRGLRPGTRIVSQGAIYLLNHLVLASAL